MRWTMITNQQGGMKLVKGYIDIQCLHTNRVVSIDDPLPFGYYTRWMLTAMAQKMKVCMIYSLKYVHGSLSVK